MIRFIKKKQNEWKVKILFYNAIAALIDNHKEILAFLQKMYVALKDVPADELQKELIVKLAEIIHEENKKKDE